MWLTLDQIVDEKENKMNISIDFDDTYTKDPLMWNWFAKQALD